MTRRLLSIWMLFITACAGLITHRATALIDARTSAMNTQARLLRVQQESAQIAALRARIPACLNAASLDASPSSGDSSPLTPRLHTVLSSLGLAPSTLANLSAQSPSRIALKEFPRTSLETQRIGARLQGLTLPQLGEVLALWRRTEPCWRITTIEVAPTPISSSPASDRRAPIATGADLPLQVGLTLEKLGIHGRGAQP